MPKATTPTSAKQTMRHNPLETDILGGSGKLRTRPENRKRKARGDLEEEEDPHFVDAKASRTILQISQSLIHEDRPQQPLDKPAVDAFAYESRLENEINYTDPQLDADEAWGDEDDVVDEIEVDPNDLDTYQKFLPEDEDPLLRDGWDGRPDDVQEQGGTNLTNLILEKIMQHEAAQEAIQSGMPVDEVPELPPKVVDVYEKIGKFLSRYRSGRLPKPFKVLPTIPHWEDIIQLTQPEKWTPHAVYAATRIFCSGNKAVARVYIEMILLPRVREDIHENSELSPHLFEALIKALYSQSAWIKGFLFPIASTLSMKEAVIVAAVLKRVSIPVLHSAAALKGLTDIAASQSVPGGSEGGGPVNVLIKTLLEKNYALPWAVVDALVFHFLRYRDMPGTNATGEGGDAKPRLPVLWHQCLKEFAKTYKNDITEDQREALLDILLIHWHPGIGPDTRKELTAGRDRAAARMPQEVGLDGDDTMLIDS